MTVLPLRVLVCGGRDFANEAFVNAKLDLLHSRWEIAVVIEGGARGADALGAAWARRRGVPVQTFPADWDRYGKAAGHRRNRQMLVEGRPSLVIAFPGGRGTANMVEQAANVPVPVWRPRSASQ